MAPLISVLLADDNRPWLLDATRWLEENGFHVLGASTGLEALEQVLAHGPDLSILDLHMPDMTGLDVLRLLRSQGISSPSILVSADATQEIRLKAMEVGFYAFLQKPIPLDLLKFTVDRAVRGRLGPPPGGPGCAR